MQHIEEGLAVWLQRANTLQNATVLTEAFLRLTDYAVNHGDEYVGSVMFAHKDVAVSSLLINSVSFTTYCSE